MDAHSGADPLSTDTAIPVSARDTPEWGGSVKPGNFRTVAAAHRYAPPYLPSARAKMYTTVYAPAPKIK